MKITSVSEPIEIRIIETDAEDYSTFQRNGPSSWERLYGDSWEEYPCCEDIEAEYQQWVANNGVNADPEKAGENLGGECQA